MDSSLAVIGIIYYIESGVTLTAFAFEIAWLHYLKSLLVNSAQFIYLIDRVYFYIDSSCFQTMNPLRHWLLQEDMRFSSGKLALSL